MPEAIPILTDTVDKQLDDKKVYMSAFYSAFLSAEIYRDKLEAIYNYSVVRRIDWHERTVTYDFPSFGTRVPRSISMCAYYPFDSRVELLGYLATMMEELKLAAKKKQIDNAVRYMGHNEMLDRLASLDEVALSKLLGKE